MVKYLSKSKYSFEMMLALKYITLAGFVSGTVVLGSKSKYKGKYGVQDIPNDPLYDPRVQQFYSSMNDVISDGNTDFLPTYSDPDLNPSPSYAPYFYGGQYGIVGPSTGRLNRLNHRSTCHGNNPHVKCNCKCNMDFPKNMMPKCLPRIKKQKFRHRLPLNCRSIADIPRRQEHLNIAPHLHYKPCQDYHPRLEDCDKLENAYEDGRVFNAY